MLRGLIIALFRSDGIEQIKRHVRFKHGRHAWQGFQLLKGRHHIAVEIALLQLSLLIDIRTWEVAGSVEIQIGRQRLDGKGVDLGREVRTCGLDLYRYNLVMPDRLKSLQWVGSSKMDLLVMPEDVIDVFGFALHLAQKGKSTIRPSR